MRHSLNLQLKFYKLRLVHMNLLKVKLFQNNLWCTRPGRILTLPSLPYNGCSPNPPPTCSCTLRRLPLQPRQSQEVSATTQDPQDHLHPEIKVQLIVKQWLSANVSLPLTKFPPLPHPQRWWEKVQVQRKNTIIQLICKVIIKVDYHHCKSN